MKVIDIKLEIEKLLQYGLEEELIKELDVVLVRNSLLDLLEVEEPYQEDGVFAVEESIQEILDRISDYAFEKGIIEENTTTYRDLFDTKVMGLLVPRPSEIVQKFQNIAKESGIEAATSYYYKLSKASNYIRHERVAKNLHWLADTDYGDIEITINLSKPEKDPKAIAEARKMKQSNYPKCLLCVDNVGYAGRINHPARQSHRVVPIQLDGEDWFLQYSPYVYYNEHSIIFSKEHKAMEINKDVFVKLLSFVEQIPHYFLGSNADLPIVGGSILSHNHFQGGYHSFPMEKAEVERSFRSEEFAKVDVGIVKWPMSVVRLRSKDKEELLELADIIFKAWKEYSDEGLNIVAYSNQESERVRHNTVTPIARSKDGYLELDLVLRNNRTDENRPDGIFHPAKELHHIKKENIGLIEVMGLAILPGRLKVELEEVKSYLKGKSYNREELTGELIKHGDWIEELLEKYGSRLSADKVEEIIKQEVGDKFSRVLNDAGVFKRDVAGKEGFIKFLNTLNIVKR